MREQKNGQPMYVLTRGLKGSQKKDETKNRKKFKTKNQKNGCATTGYLTLTTG